MTLRICQKRQQVLDTERHTLVTGGPGSGKTTIALLKALRRIEAGLDSGQAVLFLSFSRAAVARIAEAAKEQIPRTQQKMLNIQTFHSFFWDILRTYGYLLGAPKRLTLLPPHDEKALSDGIERNDPAWPVWETQREHLFREEGRIAFDLFAPKVAELLTRSARIRQIVANRFPLIIVDEAQDTGPDQWACVKALAEYSQTLCLADLEQQIFDFLPGIGPERIQQIEDDLRPTRIDLGSENNRSPDSEIATFGYDILTGVSRGAPYKGVSQLNFHPRANSRDQAIRQSIGIVSRIVKAETGQPPESIALLASFDRGAAIISNALRGGATPIPHKLLFDEATTLLASRFVAFLMEPKYAANQAIDIAQALELLSLVFRAKGTARALARSKEFQLWAQQTRGGKVPTKAVIYKKLYALIGELQVSMFSGDPRKDWMLLRGKLQGTGVSELVAVDRELQYLMAFNRGRRIASGLTAIWETHGSYPFARQALDAALTEDQILSGGEDLTGIHVMTMHKSKGKQFDAVIVFRADHSSPFKWPRDPAPYRKSRKVLRVAITRARIHTLILNQAFPDCPILAPHKL
ncbi:putative ATP-dependent DNA helicase YjcD [Pelotomaculum sp. FP]|uniref:UvrD-helicase domain-containing protein n=1 Tax=Pelotomaculum sp. FP TaxID=261474 RepID=UPI001067155A|nr:UvrD-helicase domain-containing protein [Pelotomaculum sp. FP]TEB10485.1 putative ATP-dependent DNA helicase YjcD [Pelotomaculum sp. FP]